MAANPIPIELCRFIAGSVHSVEHLEILCLLVENPSKCWSPMEAFRRIQSAEQSASNGLVYFVNRGLAMANAEGQFYFSPQTSQLGALAVALVRTYRERPVTVIETIYKKPADSAQHFADAFRLRREK